MHYPAAFSLAEHLIGQGERRCPNLGDAGFDRNKIRVTVHPRYQDVWYWLIPFSGGRSSLGVVATREFLDGYSGTTDQKLRQIVAAKQNVTGCRLDETKNGTAERCLSTS